MSDEPDRCLTDADIVAWLDGSVPDRRRSEIARHLDDCRLCAAAVEGVAGLQSREEFLESARSVRARVRAHTATMLSTSRRRNPWFRTAPPYLALAATVVLAVGAGVLLTRPAPGEALFQRYFEPYPSTQPVFRGANEGPTRGDATADSTATALALYEAHDYGRALDLFDARLQRVPDDAVVLFYAGLSRLALGRSREAARDLELARRAGGELPAPAEWYLALAELRGRDVTAARSSLKRIAEREGFYQDRARALLSELDRLDNRR
jgi:hypothetical protein